MALLRLQDIEISFGDKPVLDKVNLVVEEHERIAIVGRNGTGKSTMMKVIDNSITFDAGERIAEGEVIISRLEQEVPGALEGSIFDVVADDKIAVLELIDQLADSSRSVDEIEQIQLQIEQQDGWSVKQKVDTVISKLSLDPTRKFKQLSGGLKRRVLLARALLQEPDILLLDEPTNHLDIEAIKWLENFLSNFMGAVVFISHDRSFLSRVCTRIVELDRGYLSSWPGDYDEFLYRKAQAMAVEQAANERFDKKVQKEEEWIRQGVKARRKRNEGRVRALEDMRETLANRRKVQRNARIKIMAGELSGRKVVEVKNLSYKIGDLPIVNKFETLIKRGDKIALIGPNGVGKTTFLKLLLGELTPDMGKIKIGTNLQVAYFDQNRSQLDENASVRDSLDNGAEHVIINGRSRHVMAYLSNFLFSSKKAQSPVNALSGGERNRLLLAKLFIKPANLLVLDEPTNDLDMDTLELLEDVLINYDGTILLVSHDRYFVNQVVDACIVFKGDGEVEYFKGNYDEWLAYDKQYNQQASLAAKAQADKQAEAAASSAASEKKANKLSYKFQRELDGLPDDIATLETEIEALELQMSDPSFYQQDISLYQPILDQLAKQQAQLEEKMERWVELEGMVSG